MTAGPVLAADSHQFANCQQQQNQSAGNLKIGHGDSERAKHDFTKEDKTNRDQQARQDTEQCLFDAMFTWRMSAEAHEQSNQPDWINRDKDRNKCEEKFF